jgi:RNA polymerase sigma factor (sigma-70 family)
MNVHISYKIDKTSEIEKELNHHIAKLQKRVQAFRPELVHLKGNIEQNIPRKGVMVSLNLRLPSGQMAAQESATTATAALKAVFDELVQQLNRHKQLLRSSHKWVRRGAAEGRPQQQVPFENTIAAVQPRTVSSEDIRSYVNANLGRLELFIERELYFLETSDQIQRGSVTTNEVVDEAVARALTEGVEKPDKLALEPWLYRLAIRSINELNAGNRDGRAEVHLEDSAWKRNVQASDEPVLQFHQPDEGMTAENVIADARIPTPEDLAYSEEMITLVQFALEGADAKDREPFILYAMEGFSVDEICAILDRAPESVRNSIVAAREHLRRSPPIANRFKDRLLRKTGTA